jgi:hypothetical protein
VQVNARRVHEKYWLGPMQDQLRRVATVVHKHSNWQHLTLRAYTSAGTSLHEALQSPNVIADRSYNQHASLQPFSAFKRLRNRASVSCDGLDLVFAAELESLITTSHPEDLVDLDTLYNELAALLNAIEPALRPQGGRRTETDFASIRYAQDLMMLRGFLEREVKPCRDHGLVDGFLERRRTLLEKVTGFMDDFFSDESQQMLIMGDIQWARDELRRLNEVDLRPVEGGNVRAVG